MENNLIFSNLLFRILKYLAKLHLLKKEPKRIPHVYDIYFIMKKIISELVQSKLRTNGLFHDLIINISLLAALKV